MMKWVEVKVVFNFNDRPLAVDLISDLFYDLDLKGVVIEDSEVEGVEDWGSHPVICENDAVIGYFPRDDALRKKRKSIEQGLARLEKEIGITYRIFFADVEEVDWAESWKAYFSPEKITDQIVVKPTWRDYSQNDKEIVLEIDPGMAFGTGIHPTTRMCIALIEKYLKKNDLFLDVGTGSGILMVAAAKLGAGHIVGIDNDGVAADIARKNLLHNQIPESVFKIITGDLVHGITQRFDLAAANLTSKTISFLLEKIQKVLVQNGIFICSGILTADKNEMLAELEYAGLQIMEIVTDEEWISMACRRE
ncbi:MAG: 50S ribosomal protein L11 methyltransferase [Desulfobacterales bacterium]